MKNNKAITLVALIITIIVLLIIATVSINMIMGDNGILSKAQLAKQNTNSAAYDEENKLGKTNEIIDNYTTRSGTISDEQYNQLLDRVTSLETTVSALSGSLGSVSNNSETKTLAAASTTNIASLTLTQGKYIILGDIQQNNLALNYFQLKLNNVDFSTSYSTPSYDSQNGNYKEATITGYVNVTATKTVAINIFSRLSCSTTGSIMAIKLNN